MNTFNDASRFAWACGVFGLQPGATQQEIRAAILSHLDEANFVPPPAWRQAIWLLSDPKAPQAWPESGYDAFHEALENSLAEDVDAFATAFFSLPRGPRRAKWTQLLEQSAAFPRLRARLAPLQPGLDVESATSDVREPAGHDPGRSHPPAFRAQAGRPGRAAPPVAGVDDGRLEARRPQGAGEISEAGAA